MSYSERKSPSEQLGRFHRARASGWRPQHHGDQLPAVAGLTASGQRRPRRASSIYVSSPAASSSAQPSVSCSASVSDWLPSVSPSTCGLTSQCGQANPQLTADLELCGLGPSPASSPDRSEPASFNSAAATMTQPPPAQVPVPAPVVATREPTPQQTVPDFVTRHLDADELASMLRRADELIKSGDLSSARLLLRRVAEAGDARAAFTLAGTFDPNVLKALGLQDGAPDIALARLWYERAAQLGSADAPRRLQQLAIASAQ